MAPRPLDTHTFLLTLAIAALVFDRRVLAHGLRVATVLMATPRAKTIVACTAVGARRA